MAAPMVTPPESDAAAAAAASTLQRTLDLEQVAKCDIFTGHEDDVGKTPWGRVFGGQVLAQSLVAAYRTVPEGLQVHSLHGFFLLAGESGVEILFEVDRVRDGASFATRSVKAMQRNRAIFQMSASFHRSEWGPEFQTPGRELKAIAMSRGFKENKLPTPDELLARGVRPDVVGRADNHKETESLPIQFGDWWNLRYVRHRAPIPGSAPRGLHESIFAWISDSMNCAIVARPHEKNYSFPMKFSLDHSIHFHRPFRIDEWLCFHTRSTVSSGARGLARLEVFNMDGTLVATVTQEALIRVPKKVAAREMEKRQPPARL